MITFQYYVELKTADETKADFAAFERNDLKLREVRTVIC